MFQKFSLILGNFGVILGNFGRIKNIPFCFHSKVPDILLGVHSPTAFVFGRDDCAGAHHCVNPWVTVPVIRFGFGEVRHIEIRVLPFGCAFRLDLCQHRLACRRCSFVPCPESGSPASWETVFVRLVCVPKLIKVLVHSLNFKQPCPMSPCPILSA